MGTPTEKKEDFNIGRKLIHSAGLIFAVVYYFDMLDIEGMLFFKENTRSLLFYFIMLCYLLFWVLEFLRANFDWARKLVLKILGPVLKSFEVDGHLSSAPFFLGIGLSIGFFPKEFAICAILFLVLGDPAAAWFGHKFGKIRLANGKSIEGMLGGALFSVFVSMAFLLLHDFFNPANTLWSQNALSFSLFGVVLAGALVSFTAELFAKNGFFDDNFVIPITASVSLTFFYAIFFHTPLNHLFYPLSDLIFSAHL